MILTVTLNAALDCTYEVDELLPHGSHRVRNVRERAGGKGVNVASVLAGFGIPVTATGLVGGATGAAIRRDLDRRRVAHAFVDHGGESRRTVTVVSAAAGDATVFNEPGPAITTAAWCSAVRGISALLEPDVTVVVLSGSLPPGAPGDAYAQLVALARGRGARTVVDADGAALRLAVPAGPDVVKPNLAELRAAAGEDDPAAGVASLRRAGALDVVVSAGGDGLFVVTRDGATVAARLRDPLAGNPTGAGDAVVAALAHGLAERHPWHTTIARAVAWSGAAVLHPLAGTVDPDDVRRLSPEVVTTEEHR